MNATFVICPQGLYHRLCQSPSIWPCAHLSTSLRETDYLDRGVTHDGDQLLQSVALIEVLSGWLSNQPETVRYELIEDGRSEKPRRFRSSSLALRHPLADARLVEDVC